MRYFRRSYFQLLEVMIAAFLISLCAIPIISSFVNVYKEQKLLNNEIEQDHLARVAHAKIVEFLYTFGASGNPLEELIGKDLPVNTLDNEIFNDRLLQEWSYNLSIIGPNKEEKQEEAKNFLLGLAIKATPKKSNKKERLYCYHTFVEKGVPGQNQNPNGDGEEDEEDDDDHKDESDDEENISDADTKK